MKLSTSNVFRRDSFRHLHKIIAPIQLVALAAAAILLMSTGAAAQTTNEAPLNEQYVTEVIRKHVVGEDFLIPLIQKRGVDFQLTPELKAKLTKYGASADLLSTIDQNYISGAPPPQTMMPGVYEGKIGKGDDAKPIKIYMKDDGIKIEGNIEYDKSKGPITSGFSNNGQVSVEFKIGKEKGVITGHYKDGRISGEMTYGGKVEKVRLRWTVAPATGALTSGY